MLEKESKELHLVINNYPEPPRLIVISKKTLHRFFTVLPLAVLGIFVICLFFVWWKSFDRVSLPSIPNISHVTGTDPKIAELEAEIQAMKKAQVNMQTKLAATETTQTETWLGLVKKPYALEDLTAKNLLKLENVALEDGASKRVFRFNLINAGPESERITGHIFIFQIDGRGISPYPAMTPQEMSEGIRYNKGESFAVSRLRPVEAPFPPADTDARFLVVIFNREGDLLTRQELSGPFKASGQ